MYIYINTLTYTYDACMYIYIYKYIYIAIVYSILNRALVFGKIVLLCRILARAARSYMSFDALHCVAVCCNVLQCIAVRCSAMLLQRSAALSLLTRM